MSCQVHRENELSCWIGGLRSETTAAQGRAVSAAVEEAQGDEVVVRAEPVGDASEQPQPGVDAVGQPVRQPW